MGRFSDVQRDMKAAQAIDRIRLGGKEEARVSSALENKIRQLAAQAGIWVPEKKLTATEALSVLRKIQNLPLP